MSLLSWWLESCIVLHVLQISVHFLASGFDFSLKYFIHSFIHSLDGLMVIAWEAVLKSSRAKTGGLNTHTHPQPVLEVDFPSLSSDRLISWKAVLSPRTVNLLRELITLAVLLLCFPI